MEGRDSQSGVPADWYGDPTGRHQYRYWDGAGWTDHVADDGKASVDQLDGAPCVEGDKPEHAIILVSNESSGGSTQYILTDVSRSELKDRMLGSQLARGLDIQSGSQVDELFSQGKTETTSVVGQRQTVTIDWCTCDDPASHKRSEAAQLGL